MKRFVIVFFLCHLYICTNGQSLLERVIAKSNAQMHQMTRTSVHERSLAVVPFKDSLQRTGPQFKFPKLKLKTPKSSFKIKEFALTDGAEMPLKICGDWFGISENNKMNEVYDYFRIASAGGKYVIRMKQNSLDKSKGTCGDFSYYECDVISSTEDSLKWKVERGYTYPVGILKKYTKGVSYIRRTDYYEAYFLEDTLNCTYQSRLIYFDDYGRALKEITTEPASRFTCRRIEDALGITIEKWR